MFGNLVATPSIRLGGVEIGNLQVVFGDFEVFRMWGVGDQPAIVLGMDILGTTQALMIDYRREEIRFLPQGEENTVRIRKRVTPDADTAVSLSSLHAFDARRDPGFRHQ